jgi:hypothetical protein
VLHFFLDQQKINTCDVGYTDRVLPHETFPLQHKKRKENAEKAIIQLINGGTAIRDTEGCSQQKDDGEESVFILTVPECNYTVTRSGVFLHGLTDAQLLRFSWKPKILRLQDPTRTK